MFEVCMKFFHVEQKVESVTNYFMRLKKITAELALLLPFSPDVKVQQAQREKMVVIIFLNGLLPEFGMAKAQILSDSKIPSLDDAFTRVLRIESSPNGVFIPQSSSALINKNNNPRAPRAMDGNIASTCAIPEASVTISADGYAKFQNYQDSLQASSSSTFVAPTVASSNTMCLLISSTKWDRVTKKIIGKGHESEGLYLFNHQVWQAVACPVVPSPFKDTPFTSSPLSSCQGEDDNLCKYEITSPTDAPHSHPLPSRVYSRRPPSQPSDSCPTSMPPSSCDSGPGDDIPIALRKGKKAIGCKLVFSLKVNPDGTVARLKARLVAKDYAQTYGIDYSDTFSPVAKLTSIRLFLSMAATHNWSLHQLDIKNSFLHGDLQEEVYMEQPPVLLVVYVNDIVITGNDASGISSLKTFLQGKLGGKPSGTPMMSNQQLVKEGRLCKDPKRYWRLVGKLNYLTVTRPDIAYSVSVVSQFMSFPTVDHWAAVEQILCYLKAASGRGILYKDHGHTKVKCFSDADWVGSREDRRSISGYCVFVGGNLVSWKSKKQNVVSCSSAKSEYRAMAQSVCEIVWIHQLLSEIGFSITVPVKLWCDNQVALHIASNPVFHEQTKHIEVDCHFIREKIQDGLMSTGYVKTGEQLGDILTKDVNGARISYLYKKLDMIDIFAPA
ncbi:Retrovirus-related Pol polyprotein from transposon TNT 1-94 [Cucumis melo var. makuwa]|uniref:Retrovirus-related Pol polyprotein from transposon TNT 1-94 n=1 Tax=Cucumis melo var. makuwa TaxID=1194695 RepID=A0A5D3DZU1_CUCMM|nr:Retrovirus-related Pol polyprotein from transposon TNT 1-94 [Cucumis melo var. makuwa]